MVALGRVWALGTGSLGKTVKARISAYRRALASLYRYLSMNFWGPAFPGPQAALSCAAGVFLRALSH